MIFNILIAKAIYKINKVSIILNSYSNLEIRLWLLVISNLLLTHFDILSDLPNNFQFLLLSAIIDEHKVHEHLEAGLRDHIEKVFGVNAEVVFEIKFDELFKVHKPLIKRRGLFLCLHRIWLLLLNLICILFLDHLHLPGIKFLR